MRKNKDFEIIIQIKEGDTSKFRVLVDQYKDVSFSLAYSILKNEQDAEDALQESFIKAFTGLNKFKFQSSFSTWLYKIVVNTCNTLYKRQKRKSEIVYSDDDLQTDISYNNSIFPDLILQEQKIFIAKVLDSMKKDESLLLNLYYLADLNIAEIKEVTGFKDSKIKVTLHRARKSFQEKIIKSYGNEIKLTL